MCGSLLLSNASLLAATSNQAKADFNKVSDSKVVETEKAVSKAPKKSGSKSEIKKLVQFTDCSNSVQNIISGSCNKQQVKNILSKGNCSNKQINQVIKQFCNKR